MDPFSGLFGGGGGMPFGGGGGGGGLLGGLGMDLGLHNQPVIGNMFQDPNEAHLQAQMQAMGQAYGQYRPEAAQGRLNAMRGTMQALNPYNAAMSTMYGGAYQQRPNIQNPLSERAMGIGNPMMPGQGQQNGLFGGAGPLGGHLGPGGHVLGPLIGGVFGEKPARMMGFETDMKKVAAGYGQQALGHAGINPGASGFGAGTFTQGGSTGQPTRATGAMENYGAMLGGGGPGRQSGYGGPMVGSFQHQAPAPYDTQSRRRSDMNAGTAAMAGLFGRRA